MKSECVMTGAAICAGVAGLTLETLRERRGELVKGEDYQVFGKMVKYHPRVIKKLGGGIVEAKNVKYDYTLPEAPVVMVVFRSRYFNKRLITLCLESEYEGFCKVQPGVERLVSLLVKDAGMFHSGQKVPMRTVNGVWVLACGWPKRRGQVLV